MSTHTEKSPHLRRVRVLPIAVTIAMAMVTALFVPAPAQALGGDLTLNAEVVLLDATTGIPVGTPALSLDVPAGRSVGWNIDYGCSNTSCDDTTITVMLPTGIAAAAPNYNTNHVSAVTPISGGYRFSMAPSLAPGTTGRITFTFATTSWSTVSGANYVLNANITDLMGSSVSAPQADFTVRSDISTRVTLAQLGGGSVDSKTSYRLLRCTESGADAGAGPANIATGSRVVVELPAGASFVSAENGGVYSATPTPRITWTATGVIGGYLGCSYELGMVLEFPSAGVGEVFTLAATWIGHSINESSDRVLGTVSYDTTIVPISGGGAFAKSANPTQIAPTQNTTFNYLLGNSGNADWVDAALEDTVPDALDANYLLIDNRHADGDAVLEVTTHLGSDGIAGTADDDLPFVVATVPAQTSSGGFFPRSSWPNGHAPLGSDDWITSVKLTLSTVRSGVSGDFLLLRAELLERGHDGSIPVSAQVINTAATLRYTTPDAATASVEDDAPVTVVAPVSTIIVRAGGPGQLPINVRQGTFTYWLQPQSGSFPLREPVMALLAPEGVTFDPSTISVDPGSSPLTGMTMTTIPNWNGTTSTLYRITFAPGSSLPADGVGYAFSITATIARTVYGLATVYAYGSSSVDPVQLGDNWWLPNSDDADDKDGDGVTDEVLAKWGAQIGPARSVSASISQYALGSWDSTFVQSPARANSSPAANDVYRTVIENDGSVEMDGAIAMITLPRPGDTNILSASTRNASSSTFPVLLRSTPTLPTLSSAVTVSYTTVENPCRAELGYSPSGCNTPAWSTTPPSDLAEVTAVLIDFGTNILKPGLNWAIDLAVTTPSSGATEPDFASVNPVEGDPASDEVAYVSSAFRIREVGASSYLSPAEAPKVALAMPGQLGPVGPAPDPSALTSIGQGSQAQTVAVTVPTGGSLFLLDASGDPVSTLTVPGVGSYRVSGTDLVFEPEIDYLGTPPAVGYRIVDGFGQEGDSTYTPTVLAPASPVVTPVEVTVPQSAGRASVSVAVPAGGTVQLLDGSTWVSSLTVPGEGSYTVNTVTGSIDFVPEPAFTGAATVQSYRVVDAYAQASEPATVSVTVVGPTSPAAQISSGYANEAQSVTLVLPDGVTMQLLDPDGSAVDEWEVPGEGVYRIDPATGTISFEPATDYVGSPTPVTIQWTDSYGQHGSASYQPQVLPPAGPVAVPLTGPGGVGTAEQSLVVTIPVGGRVRLLDAGGAEATTVTVAGVGTWTLDPDTGEVVFAPTPGFSGTTPAVGYRIVDRFAQSSDSTIETEVTIPTLTALDAHSVGEQGKTQRISLTVPASGSVMLLDAAGQPTTTLRVAGVGTYTVNPTTGELVFEPEDGYVGTASVRYRLTDAYGQSSDATAYFGVEAFAVTGDDALAGTGADLALSLLLLAVLLAAGGLLVTGANLRRRQRQH